MNVLDLFCGAAGGWSLGMERAGYRTVAACEIDPWRRSVFQADHPDCLMYSDVRGVNATRIVRDLGYLPDIVIGSPPCQDISTANLSGEGINGDRSGLFWEAVRLVHEIRPRWACFENSPNLRTKGFDALADELEAGGYAVWPLVVGARHAGAPHRRDRVWLVAADASRIGRTGPVGQQARRSEERLGLAGHDLPVAPYAHGSRHPLGLSLARDDGSQLPPALRGIGRAWPDWNGGIAGLEAACAAAGAYRIHDGLPAGIRNKAIAAYGDAVVPQIAEAIGRSMTRLM